MIRHKTFPKLLPAIVPTVLLVALMLVLGAVLANEPAAEEHVTFTHGDLTLAGTLTVPTGASGPHPAIVTISGSGPQNRDSEIQGIPGYTPFADLAEHLAEMGFAVLRYDDRGVGESEGVHETATSADFAADAEAAVAYLGTRPDIDPGRIGLLGHSEGGMIAPMVAARNPDVAFIIAMAPPVADPLEGLVRQEERMYSAAGMPPEMIAEQVALTRRTLELTMAEDWTALEELIRDTVVEQFAALPEEQRAQFGDAEAATDMLVAQTMTQYRHWMHYFLTHDSQADWATLDVPALAVFAELDVQVDLEQHRAALQAVAGNNVTIAVIPDTNHLFQRTTSGSVTEYGELAPELAPQLLDALSSWLRDNVR